VPPLSAFVISIAVTNVVGAFMEQKLSRAGIEDQQVIDYAGAGFELAIVIGGIVLGGLVDKNKEYKAVTLACLIATLVATIVFGYGHAPVALCILALLAVGAFAGPVQPINAELAVEVTYPSDENAIEAIQQLCGNLFSALLLPICEFAALYEFPVPGVPGLQREHLPGEKWESGADSIQGDTLVLFFLILSVTLYFSTFSGRLRRTEVDENKCIIEEGEEESPKPLGGSPSVTLVDRAGSPVSVIIGAEEVAAKK
jgi:MFS family permease